MKNTGVLIIAATVLSSCSQTETKTETIENSDGTVSVKTIETEKTSALDSATIQSTVNNAKEKLNEAGKTLNEAGKDIKVAAQKGAEKVEKGAEKVQADLSTKRRDTVR
ncbi:hypothetical protein CO230_11400 [Chryseobacterium sp. 6424]|uniref:hypothetical protein n=1 Tax=Chryseobacterium sp. 6424 TaxID=2039166 RepID=UPI000EFA32AD|nr:hypothetical protein [Chryseobacterium sp. 6424]AYO58668.1 hypothetical protein CO230_11400 [Chryseobacterium sp. 6424]